MSWYYNPNDEHRLTTLYGVEHERATIRHDQIDWERSRHNQNRDKFDDKHAEQFAWSMTRGEPVPAPIVRPSPNHPDRFYMLDGNHRGTGSLSVGDEELDVLVVTNATDDVARMIAQFANLGRENKPVSNEQRRWVVVTAFNEGLTKAQIAAKANITEQQVANIMLVHRAQRTVELAGVKLKKPLTVNKARALQRLDQDEIASLGRDAIDATTPTQLDEATREIADQPHAERHDRAVEVRGRLKAERTTGNNTRGAVQQVKTGITQIKRNLRTAFTEATPQQADRFYDDIHELYLQVRTQKGNHSEAA